MKKLEKIMKNQCIPSNEFESFGDWKKNYVQINVNAGWCVNIDKLKQDLFNEFGILAQFTVSTIMANDSYILLIEVFW